jgi:predicted ATPase
VLPIVVELLSRRESIIAVEQPETHLHPRLQARLADLFIDTTQEGGRGNQLIVETHSEHLMLRVQRRIREGMLDASLVSIVYIDQDADGLATAKQLRLNDHGEFLDEWPNGFFDDRLEELFGEY